MSNSPCARTQCAALRYATTSFNRLAVAIADLNEGRTDRAAGADAYRWGQPRRRQTAEWLGRANVALGMAALVAGGETLSWPLRRRNVLPELTSRSSRLVRTNS